MDQKQANEHNALIIAKLILLLVDMQDYVRKGPPILDTYGNNLQQQLLKRFDELLIRFRE